MKKIFKSQNLKENRVYIILGIIIAFQLATIIYSFQFRKEGYHSDEIWSYGYANSYYQRDVHRDQNYNFINIAEWVDAQFLRDYLVVNEGEEFTYDSIYQNQLYDLSPPFHSMLLHTISSFFPGHFSRWFSFWINILSFIICMVFLFKIARELKNDFFALLVCLTYGFSFGARDTFIYLRMYALCTALVMIIIYNYIKVLNKIKKENKISICHLITLCLVSFVGFLTHYYIIAFTGVLTFLICVLLLFKKRIKAMFVCGFSMLITLVLSILVFPSLIHTTQYQGNKIATESAKLMNYNFEMRFRIITNFLTTKLFDLQVSIYPSGIMPIIGAYVFVFVIFSIPLGFLFRNTKFVKWIIRRIRFLFTHFKGIVKYLWRRINWIYVILLVTIFAHIIIVGETSNVCGMGPYLDRYIMFLFPIAMLVALAFVYQIGMIIFKRKKYCNYILSAVVILLVTVNINNRIKYVDYFFQQEIVGESISEAVKDKSCIYVMERIWMLTTLTPELMNAKEFFQVGFWEYNQYESQYMERLQREPVVLMVDTTFSNSLINEYSENENIKVEKNNIAEEKSDRYKDLLNYFEDLEPKTKMQKLGSEYVFGRKMEYYLINP